MAIDSKALLLRQLDQWHAEYSPEHKMVRKPFRTPGYHSTLKDVAYTHPTRDALVYALALLDSGVQEHVQRASEIIEKVIGLQDQNPESRTYGIWSWFLEEPLAMMAPPDWNWADFCGKRLVLAAQRHAGVLDSALQEQIRQALFCACGAIIKRDVGPGYTNIAIMGAFVTLLTGEVYGHQSYADYGLERLRKFSRYTKELGTFQEYNSPTYTIIAIEELSSIHTSVSHAEAKELSAELLDVAWRMLAEHFHVPSKQWSGPHSRSYSTVMTPASYSFLQLASRGALAMLAEEQLVYNLDWYGNDIQCPEPYLPAFREEVFLKTIRQPIAKDESGAALNTATTYLNGPLSLGTYSKDVMWNQRRNLLAYIAEGEDRFSYVHLRFLRDGYDYSSAVFTSVQEESEVLFGIGFCTNGGNTHIGLDPIDGTVDAADLRLRFEIGGSLERVEEEALADDAEAATVHIAGHAMTVRTLFAAFDGERPRWELTRDGQKLCLDYVVYSGSDSGSSERKTFDFRTMEQALLLFALRFSVGAGGPLDATAMISGTEALAESKTRSGAVLQLALPLKPGEKRDMMRPRT
ncbi:hypothetical protein [Paenibacillus cremeus]|uniref:Uncharacterized protein n=1 Tax=Paenibacillus cremeus TaxID=2163881 RepID=A0A559JZV5_9BACL|nr:hypothetical protein [Paenibacillus cremeus]TVY05432.1 hypothetical protein FPZ49_30395 [Paenibacillus cremeus]